MATTPLTRVVTTSSSYTIPAGMHFIGSIVIDGTPANAIISVTTPGGTAKVFSRLENASNVHGVIKPVVLVAGTVVSVNGGNVLLTGFNFDN